MMGRWFKREEVGIFESSFGLEAQSDIVEERMGWDFSISDF